jgi:hypothetical protein
VARQYSKQKVWPRAVYVRRARFVNKHLNSVDDLILMPQILSIWPTAMELYGTTERPSGRLLDRRSGRMVHVALCD